MVYVTHMGDIRFNADKTQQWSLDLCFKPLFNILEAATGLTYSSMLIILKLALTSYSATVLRMISFVGITIY